MPDQAKKHFDEDIARSRAILEHAKTLTASDQKMLHDDLLRSAWMFAVGAMDAYFCDAYASVLARTLKAKHHQNDITLPQRVQNIEISVGDIFASYGERKGWRWRMAVRKKIQKKNMLDVSAIKNSLNPFMTNGNKLYEEVIESWILSRGATKRLFGLSARDLNACSTKKAREEARKQAVWKLTKRLNGFIQRRHDCIHNCDRPKYAINSMERENTVKSVLDDIAFFVTICNDHIDSEWIKFVDQIGCSSTTKNKIMKN